MKESLKKIFDLLPNGDPYKIALLFVMMIVASLLALLGVGMVPLFVVAVLESDKVLNLPVLGEILLSLNITTPAQLAIFGSFALFSIYLLKNLFMLFYDYTSHKFMLNRKLFLKNRLFHAYMYSPYMFYLNRNSSELIRNISNEASNVLEGALKPILNISLHSLMITIIVSALIYTEPLISGIGIILFGGFSVVFLNLTKVKIENYGSEALNHRNLMTRSLLQGLGGFKDAKVLKRENYFLNEFNHHADKIRFYDLWNALFRAMPRQIIEMLALSGVLFIAIVMVIQGREVTSIVPIIALFGAAVMKIKPSINSIIEQINKFRYHIFSINAIYDDLIKLENRKFYKVKGASRNHSSEILSIKKGIDLMNIEFTYPDSNIPALQNIHIHIPKNKAVAFVGPSGSGKTTIADLILGLLEPDKGTVKVDGVNIFDNIDGWQKNIGYIPQHIYLVDDTIRNNICFGLKEDEIDEERLAITIDTAQLREFINSLENGDQTIVGEEGIRISGGQRQRIGIARALYNNPQLLIMDEATSALDNVTEKNLVHAIEKLKGEKTIIMIAHRLTTVQNCDKIYMMKQAEIIASGTYFDLLNTNEEFRKMSLVDEPA
jgi:ATP-binding cassette, subfamily B, bacterial PglK